MKHIYINCIHCNSLTTNPKFCSQSCAASYNNKGKRRHGKPANNCKICGNKTQSSQRIFCSRTCASISKMKSKEHKRAQNAAAQSKYRQKKYRKIDISANSALILEIYRNCPEGFEVDHIIPVSKDGLHHENNLQYLPKYLNRIKSNKLVNW